MGYSHQYYYKYYRVKKKIEGLNELYTAYLILLRMFVRFFKNSRVTPDMVGNYRKALAILEKRDKENYDFIAPICLKVIEILEERSLHTQQEQTQKQKQLKEKNKK